MTQKAREGYGGTGAGPITPDGSAVEHWLRLPPGPEPGIVADAVPGGGTLLELGCGVGRLTGPLTAAGFRVTAVDESAVMLEHVREARTVCSPIESLDLGGERFDVVLLASFLVHNGDPRVREGLLRTCRRHVAENGWVLIQRERASWRDQEVREASLPGGGLVRVAAIEPAGPDLTSVLVEYAYPDARWTQRFLSYGYPGDTFEEALAAAGLAIDAYLTEDRTWLRARPV
ncbi:class I SAM-dependent methyltransferase [Streptomyces xiamenensis]|uniref:class I SAM-dependent methyltransferase n=1 Tax=Streptomyces xiamenensis TaxID=408015 RepID=UPI0035E16B9E